MGTVACRASASMPYDNLKRAAAGLWAELRHQMLDAGEPGAPDWSVLTLTGFETAADERERIWFTWTATVAVRPQRGRACEA